MNRQEWLKTNRLPDLVKSLKTYENLNICSQQLFETFTSADPSNNKSAVQWLIETYQRKGFLYEDIQAKERSKVYETLKLFDQYKRRLNLTDRNLYSHKTLSDLYKSIQSYHLEDCDNVENIVDNSARAQKENKKLAAYQQTYFLFKNDHVEMVIPLTQESAQWWGQGTRW